MKLKKALLTFLFTILAIVSVIPILHFIALPITTYFRKKKGNYHRLIRTKRCELSLTASKSLMVDFTHEHKMNFDESPFAKSIMITFGGLHFTYRYGHDFITDNINDDCKTRYYGFYSVDGEYFWNCIWWNHLYENPYRPSNFLGCWYIDLNTGERINRKDCETTPIPYVDITCPTYTDKNGDTYKVNKIDWCLVERRWSIPILEWLGLGKLYNLMRLYLEFDTDTELGVKRGSWKGGVMGSDIRLDMEKSEIVDCYKQYLRTKKIADLIKVSNLCKERIYKFMNYDKLY